MVTKLKSNPKRPNPSYICNVPIYVSAQQRVLQRSEHVVELAGGPLVLTVRDSPEPTSKSISPKVDLTSSQVSFPKSEPAEIFQLVLKTLILIIKKIKIKIDVMDIFSNYRDSSPLLLQAH